MIETLLLYGATGDLAGRYLMPALAELHAADLLPRGFRVTATGRRDMDDEAFRQFTAERLAQHAEGLPVPAREAVLRSLSYRQADIDDKESVRRILGDSAAPVAAYLALPPDLFAPAIAALGAVGLPPGSRIAVEKPFGEDLDDAVALNAQLVQVAGDVGEQAIFRVDHVLGMATVQNLLGLRFANPVLEQVWNSHYIEQVEILWEETIALEGRGGYFDETGALKDVMQNHVMQVFSIIAMEPPASLEEQDLRDRKVEALRSVRPLSPGDVAQRTRRARYTAGRLAGTGGAEAREVPDYAAEDGVDPARGTETFAEVTLEMDSSRWTGTRFVLRAGKALAARRKGVVIRFRPVANGPFAQKAAPNEMWIGIDGPENIALHLTGTATGLSKPAPLTMTAPPPASDLPAYGRVLFDLLSEGSSLSVRGDEAELAWRIVTPVLQAWADGRVPLEEYQAGSTGPTPRAENAPSGAS